MASDLGVGDAEVPWLDVAPADDTTVATLEVRPPQGAPYLLEVTAGPLEAIPGTSPVEYTQRWTAVAPVAYALPSKWVLHWDVDGTGEGEEDQEVWVVASPVAGGPAWAPGRSRVAAYVPRRTLVRSTTAITGSRDQYLWDWDSTTTPSGLAVSRLIADGVAWVQARVHPMHASSEEAAGVCAAIYAAAMVERLQTDQDSALARANDLEKRLDVLLSDLARSNTAANDEDDGTADGFDIVYPVWQFAAADPRWDNPGSF